MFGERSVLILCGFTGTVFLLSHAQSLLSYIFIYSL
jgi:hypothetical protein